jgi:hypothetical protein
MGVWYTTISAISVEGVDWPFFGKMGGGGYENEDGK